MRKEPGPRWDQGGLLLDFTAVGLPFGFGVALGLAEPCGVIRGFACARLFL